MLLLVVVAMAVRDESCLPRCSYFKKQEEWVGREVGPFLFIPLRRLAKRLPAERNPSDDLFWEQKLE